MADPPSARTSTGVEGLNDVLGGGLTSARMYLMEGAPGSGKTTFALRFLMAGVEQQQSCLYITLSETAEELRGVVQSHGWSLDGIQVHELVGELGTAPEFEQSILHPSEIELGETVAAIISEIERLNPMRVVFDSLSEMRLLAQNPLRYRRQILALKQFFAHRQCTVLLLDDKTSGPSDLHLHSIAHGVISLDQSTESFGGARRHLRVVKMRGLRYRGGCHDFVLDTGRVDVFPRLVAGDHHADFSDKPLGTGLSELDDMLGGGLVPGTNTLLLGPSGVGKSTTAVRCLLTALQRGQSAAYYLFDEGLATLLARSKALGMDLSEHVASGKLVIHQIDPAELSAGEFAHMTMRSVLDEGRSMIVIDSLNAYMLAMPGQTALLLHMHELLTFLNQQGVTTILIVGQHGLVGETRSDIDLSYLSDSVLAYRFFECQGEVRTAIAAIKSRTAQNRRTIHELRLSSDRGLQIGHALKGFEGVLSGLATYRGGTPMLSSVDSVAG